MHPTNLIKHFEGFSPVTYTCPAGYRTIGYGHVIKPHEKFEEPISLAEGEKILIADCKKFAFSIYKLISAPLTTNQLSALLSFTFNLGSGALQRSTLRQKINRLEYKNAAEEFLKWIYAGGKILPGLITRRKAERDLFLG